MSTSAALLSSIRSTVSTLPASLVDALDVIGDETHIELIRAVADTPDTRDQACDALRSAVGSRGTPLVRALDDAWADECRAREEAAFQLGIVFGQKGPRTILNSAGCPPAPDCPPVAPLAPFQRTLTGPAVPWIFNVRINPNVPSLLKLVKMRDGLPESEQIRRALYTWLQSRGLDPEAINS